MEFRKYYKQFLNFLMLMNRKTPLNMYFDANTINTRVLNNSEKDWKRRFLGFPQLAGFLRGGAQDAVEPGVSAGGAQAGSLKRADCQTLTSSERFPLKLPRNQPRPLPGRK